jgi:hypothetical protein
VNRVETLRAEVEWFAESLENARKLAVYPALYLDGYASALGWLKLHLAMAEVEDA